jgi:Ca-activated chloride channel family protein
LFMRAQHLTHTLSRSILALILFAFASLLLAACGDTDSAESGSSGTTSGGTTEIPGGVPGVGQGGAQDFGLFRGIVEAGQVPAPEALDDVGFFNEHKLNWPAPNCGDDLCIHGLLGVMGNFMTGSNCTMIMIGMNTPIDPTQMERPPLNLALAVDTSGSMAGDSIRFAREGLLAMLPTLTPEDRVTLVVYGSVAEVLIENAPGDDPALAAAINELRAEGSTNIYDGLRTAFEAVERNKTPGAQNRVILLSDGVATTGIDNNARILRMAEAYAAQGIGISSIGMGTEFDVGLMRSISEQGSGNFYFLENPAAVVEVFSEELSTFLVPLAEDVRIRFKVGGGYNLRRIYGTRLSSVGGDTGYIDIPSLFIAHRTKIEDPDTQGRRGGGGAIVVELMPQPNAPAGFDPNEVGQLIMEYRVPGTEEIRQQDIMITSPLSPGDTPEAGHFTSDTVRKGFVMLNMFVGMQMATTRAEAGDNLSAVHILSTLDQRVSDWLKTQTDADIEDDLEILRKLRTNIQTTRNVQQVPDSTVVIPEPWPFD